MSDATPRHDRLATFISVVFVVVAVVGIGAALIGAFLFFPGTNQVPGP
ncbi:MAG TPA: hypothetical protein VGC47_06600 [Acidimicrobiia bacterium]